MRKFLAHRLSISDLIDLFVCVILGGAIENFVRTEADSDHQEPERIMIGTVVAVGSYLFAFLVVYLRKHWFEFIPNWVVFGIFGSFVNSLINHGILVVFHGSSDRAEEFLSILFRMNERTNAVIGSTIAYSLVILTVLSVLKLLLLLIELKWSCLMPTDGTSK